MLVEAPDCLILGIIGAITCDTKRVIQIALLPDNVLAKSFMMNLCCMIRYAQTLSVGEFLGIEEIIRGEIRFLVLFSENVH
jgi:hypothetical protein